MVLLFETSGGVDTLLADPLANPKTDRSSRAELYSFGLQRTTSAACSF